MAKEDYKSTFQVVSTASFVMYVLRMTIKNCRFYFKYILCACVHIYVCTDALTLYVVLVTGSAVKTCSSTLESEKTH